MKKTIVNKSKEENQLEFGLLNKYILNLKNTDNIHISLINEPFPILVINNAIQKDIYDKLDFEYPSLKTILECNNLKSNQKNPIILNHTSRYSISGKTLNNDFNYNFNNNPNDNLTSLWKSFINYHNSNNSNDKKETKDLIKSFKKDILDTFNKINLNKNLKNKNITNDNLERDLNKILNFNLDFTFNYNLPVCYNYEPKLYEIENDKIVSGWFLMKKDNDNSKGGNLEIFYETLNDTENNNENNNKKLTKIISIPYQKNCLVLLFNQNINEKNKIKFGFSQRQLTIHTQRYLNF